MRTLVLTTAFLALLCSIDAFPKFNKFDPFFNPYDKFEELKKDDPCKPKCETHEPKCKSPCDVGHPQTISLTLDPSSFATKFAHQSAPKAQIVQLAPPIADHQVEVLLDATVCEENPFPSSLKPTFNLKPELKTCKDKLPKAPCQPHPWCYHDRKDHFYHDTCHVDCPCPFHIWGKWCCDPDFACLSSYDKWDIAKSFGSGFGKSFSGFKFDCGGGYGGDYYGHGGYGGGFHDYGYGHGGGFHGGYACGSHFWKK